MLRVTETEPERDANAFRDGLRARLLRRATAQGTISLPAVPAMLDEYEALCLSTFRALGVEFSAEQAARLRAVLSSQLDEAFAASPRSEIVVTYESPVGTTVEYHVRAQWSSVEDAYDAWVNSRQPPYFGHEPDAKVMRVAGGLSEPSAAPVLDLGAGTGRNALPLARLGHPVDAIDLSAAFADLLEASAEAESLNVSVLRRDALAAPTDLRRDYALVVASELATDFRSEAQLRRLLHLGSSCLREGGYLVMNAFMAKAAYEPDAAAIQLGQQLYSSPFTSRQVAEALRGTNLAQVSDECASEFERVHLPDGAWPPTGWYQQWAEGRDLFELPAERCPVELRWLVFVKEANSSSARGFHADAR